MSDRASILGIAIKKRKQASRTPNASRDSIRHGHSKAGKICGAVALVFCGLAGCNRFTSRPAPPHAIPPSPLVSHAEAGQFGGRFTLALSSPPRTFNPVVANDGSSDAIIRLLHGSLITLNWANQQPGPGLAESWTNSADGKTFTFKLRQGLYWSDGARLTSDDVVFTWNELMYNANYNRFTSDLFRIRGQKFQVSRIDDLTVQVVTPEVFAPFVEFFGGVSILPRHVLEKAARNQSFNAVYSLST